MEETNALNNCCLSSKEVNTLNSSISVVIAIETAGYVYICSDAISSASSDVMTLHNMCSCIIALICRGCMKNVRHSSLYVIATRTIMYLKNCCPQLPAARYLTNQDTLI